VAVSLRLSRYGKTKKAYYRIIATEKQNKRDGNFIEIVGTFNPMIEPPVITLKEDRIKYWISVGAQVQGATRDIIRKKIPGLIENREEHQLAKVKIARKKRKERIAATSKSGAKTTKKKK